MMNKIIKHIKDDINDAKNYTFFLVIFGFICVFLAAEFPIICALLSRGDGGPTWSLVNVSSRQ